MCANGQKGRERYQLTHHVDLASGVGLLKDILIDRVGDVGDSGSGGRPCRLPAEGSVYNGKVREDVVRPAAPVVKVRYEKRVDAGAGERCLEAGLPVGV